MAGNKKQSGDDPDLFRKALSDVQPIKGRKRDRIEKKAGLSAPKLPTTKKPAPTKSAVGPTARPSQLPKRPSSPELAAGDFAGVDRRTADRFRRGRMEIGGRLDLHGMYQDEAHAALQGFIAGAASGGKRCVIVITGKGRISEGGGVLRREVPKWLNQAGLREHVLSFTRAQPEHGGDGALYVLLKRKRQ